MSNDLRLWLPGTSGDCASTPDSAALDVTQDITIVVRVLTPPDRTSDFGRLVDKGWTSGSRAWAVWLRTTGVVSFRASSDGTAQDTAIDWSPGATLTAGTWLKIESTWGGASRTTTFSTSADGVTWTLRSSQVGGASAIAANAVRLTVGADPTGLSAIAGQIGAVRIYDGDEATGTLVADFDPARDAALGDSTVTSSTTGETWTLNGDALLIGGPVRSQAVRTAPAYLDGQHATSPDSAAKDAVVSTLTVVAQMVSYDPAAEVPNARILDAGVGNGWALYVDGLNRLGLVLDGSAGYVYVAFNTHAENVTAGTWVKAEVAASTTAPQVRWWTSPDGVTWTLRETDSLTAGTLDAIKTNTARWTVGADSAGANRYSGKIGRIMVYAGDADTGALVADFAPELDAHLGATSWTSAATGEVWTVAGDATVTADGPRLDWLPAAGGGIRLPHLRPLRGLDVPPSRWSAAPVPQRPGAVLTQAPVFDPRTVTVPILLRPDPPHTTARLEAERARYAAALAGGSDRVGTIRVADSSAQIRELRDVIYADGLAGTYDLPGHDLPVLLFQAFDPHFYSLGDETADLTAGTNTLAVVGDAEPEPVFTITGGASSNITGVTLERVDTGETVDIDLTSALTTGVALVIDCGAYTAHRAGVSVFSELVEASFFRLGTGASQVALTLTGTAGSYTATVAYRPRWLTAWATS